MSEKQNLIPSHKTTNRHKHKLFLTVRQFKDGSCFPMDSFLTEDEAKEYARLQMTFVPNKDWIYFIMEVPVNNLVLKKWQRRKSVVESNEILLYTHNDFKVVCEDCKKNLLERYKYCARDDKFWLECIKRQRDTALKLLAFVKEIYNSSRDDTIYDKDAKVVLDGDDYTYAEYLCGVNGMKAEKLLEEIGELECPPSRST